MVPDLTKITELFLLASSFLVAALGTADTNYHKAAVSLLGLVISMLWWPCTREALSEAVAKDPLLHRTFGAIARGPCLARQSPNALATVAKSNTLDLSIDVLNDQTDTIEQWQAQLDKQAATTGNLDRAETWKAHCQCHISGGGVVDRAPTMTKSNPHGDTSGVT